MLIRNGIFYKHKYSDPPEPAHTYQYIMHTDVLKDASEEQATGQTVSGMLRAYKLVNMQTQTYVHSNPRLRCAAYQRAAGRPSVMNEPDRAREQPLRRT